MDAHLLHTIFLVIGGYINDDVYRIEKGLKIQAEVAAK